MAVNIQLNLNIPDVRITGKKYRRKEPEFFHHKNPAYASILFNFNRQFNNFKILYDQSDPVIKPK